MAPSARSMVPSEHDHRLSRSPALVFWLHRLWKPRVRNEPRYDPPLLSRRGRGRYQRHTLQSRQGRLRLPPPRLALRVSETALPNPPPPSPPPRPNESRPRSAAPDPSSPPSDASPSSSSRCPRPAHPS